MAAHASTMGSPQRNPSSPRQGQGDRASRMSAPYRLPCKKLASRLVHRLVKQRRETFERLIRQSGGVRLVDVAPRALVKVHRRPLGKRLAAKLGRLLVVFPLRLSQSDVHSASLFRRSCCYCGLRSIRCIVFQAIARSFSVLNFHSNRNSSEKAVAHGPR